MYAYSQIEYENESMNEFIEKEMHKTKKEVSRKLSSMFVHSQTNKEWSSMLAYCWFDSLPSAEKIADHLDLCKLDFLAIQEDFEGFKEEYLKYYEEAQNF